MDGILRRTHAKENIDILRARDYYFNVAKTISLLKSVIVFSLPVAIAVSYIPFVQSRLGFSDSFRDVAIGVLTLLVIALSAVLDHRIDRYTDISNTLREYYDYKVLEIEGTCFIHDFTQIRQWLGKALKVPYSWKYEVWYSEIFSTDKNRNVLCCQLDNILYAVYAYKTTEYVYRACLVVFFLAATVVLGLLAAAGNWQSALLIAFSVVECFEVLHGKLSKLKESRERCTQFSEMAKELDPQDLDDATITAMEHAVIENRSLCVFLPEFIRAYFLRDRSKYYQALDAYKKKFWGDDAILPETDSQIELVSEDGRWGIPLSEIHGHLKAMLKEVIDVFEKENIHYTLDGGTLIGAMRTSAGGFIPWDDDIDIAIAADQAEKAKAVLKEQLPYCIQDAENERFYSPRLAAFRVREDNRSSIVNEKDSPLYTKYQYRGVVIDVYAYSPVLKSIPVDKLFRRLFLHPLHKQLKRVEDSYPLSGNPAAVEKRFLRLKDRYMRRLSFYRKHAKNTAYCVYSPEYIHSYQHPGPYFSADVLFDKRKETRWEEMWCRIPTDPEEVLKSYYGAQWRIPPFQTKRELLEALKEERDRQAKEGVAAKGRSGVMGRTLKSKQQEESEKEWYSQASVGITVLKHLSNVVFADASYARSGEDSL